MALDMAAVERELCRIPEVRAARIVADADGKPVEVHVLATPTKHAKQIVRDVQSVAVATVGLELDHRIISVVQLDEPDGAAMGNGTEARSGSGPGTGAGAGASVESDGPAANPASAVRAAGNGGRRTGATNPDRILVDSVTVVRRGVTCSATVTLTRGEETASASADGATATSVTPRLVARATLEALRTFLPTAAAAEVETAVLARLGERNVAVTTIVLAVPPHEDVVTGSAPVRAGGEHDAVARAVLDATNRRFN